MLKKSTNFHKKEIKRKRNDNRIRNRNREFLSNDFFTFEIFEIFKRFRQTFMKISIFQYFDSIKFIRVKIDVSNFVIKNILCQSNDENH